MKANLLMKNEQHNMQRREGEREGELLALTADVSLSQCFCLSLPIEALSNSKIQSLIASSASAVPAAAKRVVHVHVLHNVMHSLQLPKLTQIPKMPQIPARTVTGTRY